MLVLLGVAATDFMITMALSAADATAHLIQNPFAPDWLQGQNVLVTLFLFAMLGAVFLRGFKEAIGVAVVLVAIYLGLNLVVLTVSVFEVFTHPVPVDNWWQAISTSHGNPLLAVGFALLVFPKHALGLSGFERGVAVIPQIQGHAGDTEKQPRRPHPGTRKLLTTAALIMSSFLIVSSFTTVVLIPEQEFQPDGQANGRALAFLAHENLGDGFGTVYDLSTIAGASAMAGLLNLVPRYGMAPGWARARRRQQRKRATGFGIIAVVLIYTTVPDAGIVSLGDASRSMQPALHNLGAIVLEFVLAGLARIRFLPGLCRRAARN